jgi:alpha-mannosidase
MPNVHLICNAHLDPVWQWRWEEGCAETLSTFRTALQLLQEHPSLIFNHNEAVLYRWVQQYDPALFASIQQLARQGRWVISGGWYLQPDVNLPGTESLVRQMLVGRRFFREHFGVTPRVAYNFDSFGHSAGLPQLLRQAGFEMYIHMRPQAPDLELPSDLYRWRGLDGSEILALRIVVGLYHTERDNIEQRLNEGVELALKLNRDVPVFWGIGNHGGGPTREDLRRIDHFIAREKRATVLHSSPERLLEALHVAGQHAPVHRGDLQRVFTGCYTSLARLKRQAVKSLGILQQTEALRAWTWWQFNHEYPAAALAQAWRDHLFNDFHDILPGSCIEPGERDALGLYAAVEESCRRLLFGAAVAFNSGPGAPAYIPITVLNSNPACCRVPIEVECMLDLRPKWSGRWHLRLFDLQGRELPCQEEQPESLLPFNGWRRKVVFETQLPPLGAAQYKLEINEGTPAGTVDRDSAQPEQPRFKAGHVLDPESGLVISLRATGGRECLRGPLLKGLVVNDQGDAWGSNQWAYRDLVGEFEFVPGSLARLASGPVRNVFESVHIFGHSRIVQQVISYPGFPALEFRLRLHWQEPRRRLKLSIPTLLKAESVFCEVPGGAWSRPADGQEHVHGRWLMLEGLAQGQPTAVAVVHEGLHGFDVKDGEIRLSALRSAAYCHEQGFKLEKTPTRKFMDQGVHEIRLLVLAGDPAELRSKVPGLANWLTMPPRVYAHLPLGIQDPASNSVLASLLRDLPQNVILQACKRAEDGQHLVLRLQELSGLGAGLKLQRGDVDAIQFEPFESKTFMVERDGVLRETTLLE